MSLPPRKYFIEKEFPLPREKVWELLSDTDHLNRVIGLFAVKPGPAVSGDGGFVRTLAARVGGLIPLRWNEYPFKWTKNSSYSVVRRYLGGPMKQFHGGVQLRDGESVLASGKRATIVHLFAEFTPRNLIGAAAIPIVGQGSMKNTMTYLSDFLRLNRGDGIERLPGPRPSYRFDHRELDLRLAEISDMPVSDEIGILFREHLRTANDDEVIDMNPYHLADRWGMQRQAVLRWFLYATKAGVTNMTWQLICPNCRVAKVGLSSLSAMDDEFHCDFCGIAYSPNFDRYVELTFSVHPSIRDAHKYTYCVGGPTITPHIFVQSLAERASSELIDVPQEPSEYRIRVLQANHSVAVHRAETSSESQTVPVVAYREDGWAEPSITIPTTARSIEVRNESEQDIVLASEKTDWSDDAVTAAAVTAMGEFRRMFSSEVLAPGRQIGIENVTLMFTDLRGSTSFYEEVGDAPAYGRVQHHFAYLVELIEKNNGSVVKTIGDAVMAVFGSAQEGVAAALQIQQNIDTLNADAKTAERLVIKIGVHSGPAIVVNLNDRLDYFGRTVNVAARIQGLSEGRDIVTSGKTVERRGVSALLERSAAEMSPFTAELKGVREREPLYRIRLQ